MNIPRFRHNRLNIIIELVPTLVTYKPDSEKGVYGAPRTPMELKILVARSNFTLVGHCRAC